MTSQPENDEIHAWVDGRLSGERLRRFEESLAQDEAARERALAWRAQARELAALGREVLDEPVPERLLRAATPAGASSRPARAALGGSRLWMAAASLAALAWGAGWLSHAHYRDAGRLVTDDGSGVVALGARGAAPAFVRDAVAAHVVYTPEVRHPVEVAAEQHEHLVQWLSKRLGVQLQVPSLDAAGWSLVGGRLLPGSEGARAQFMYEDASGARLTLYVADAGADTGDTAFRYESDGRVAAFYWIDGRFGYTLAAQLERAVLLGLAEEIYRQLTGAHKGAPRS